MVTVQKDEHFCQKFIKKCEQVFTNFILPELIVRGSDTQYDSSEKWFCICKRPSFPPMISCDGNNCEIGWFHYSCVNILRKPIKKWYCPKCKVMSVTTMKKINQL
jgi:hypothetical protein